MSLSVRRLAHLHIYSSLHKDAHHDLVSLAFPPQDPTSAIGKHAGFPLMDPLQQQHEKQLHKVEGGKCQAFRYGSMRGAI